MIIKSLDLKNFRNYETLHLELGEGIHILYGDNAQGKTNILEAVYLASVNRSHRGAKDKEMIRFGEEEAHLKLLADKKGLEYRIDMHLKKSGSKGIAVNGVPIRKSRDFLGIVRTVFFSPEDLQLVKEGPAERRKFIDNELCQLDAVYLNAWLNYKKALEERNQLLKDIYFTPSLRDTLEIWDEQLLRFGTELIERRKSFIDSLSVIVRPVHEKLSGGRETPALFYEANVSSEDFRDELSKAHDRDLKAKTTTVGPHRDDMAFMVNDIDARIYGSQGQQRTSALSLKMAEIELVKEKTGESPILLLDDVLSELDRNRQEYLLESIGGIQTIITCTGLNDFVEHQTNLSRVYKVENGEVKYG